MNEQKRNSKKKNIRQTPFHHVIEHENFSLNPCTNKPLKHNSYYLAKRKKKKTLNIFSDHCFFIE